LASFQGIILTKPRIRSAGRFSTYFLNHKIKSNLINKNNILNGHIWALEYGRQNTPTDQNLNGATAPQIDHSPY